MTHRWLHLRLAAPLMSFGGVTIDHVGPTRKFPAVSALTGLFANALGWRRDQTDLHQALQDRIEFGALNARSGRLMTDNQNARAYEEEPGWTTHGEIEARNKGSSYSNPATEDAIGNQVGRKWLTHRRRRDYLADHDCRVVLRLTEGQGPSPDDLAAALDRPARPLFIGRKPCLPSGPLFQGWIEAPDVKSALIALGLSGPAIWPQTDEDIAADLPDMRNWKTGLHGGSRQICEGVL